MKLMLILNSFFLMPHPTIFFFLFKIINYMLLHIYCDSSSAEVKRCFKHALKGLWQSSHENNYNYENKIQIEKY